MARFGAPLSVPVDAYPVSGVCVCGVCVLYVCARARVCVSESIAVWGVATGLPRLLPKLARGVLAAASRSGLKHGHTGFLV